MLVGASQYFERVPDVQDSYYLRDSSEVRRRVRKHHGRPFGPRGNIVSGEARLGDGASCPRRTHYLRHVPSNAQNVSDRLQPIERLPLMMCGSGFTCLSTLLRAA